MRFVVDALAMKHIGVYTLFVLLSAGCGKQPEPVSQPPKMEPAKQGEVKAFETLSVTETTGSSAIGRTHSGQASQTLLAVRVGKQTGMDRLVFEFNEAGLPEWEVKYVEPALLVECGSGDPVSIAGSAWLQITFRGAQAHTEAGAPTSGPYRRKPGQAALLELVRTCDFEGEVTWVAGVVRESKYTPRVLDEPSRLVIDIAH